MQTVIDPHSEQMRSVLKREFARRCRKNSRYSIRAFARSLALAPSALSEMMSGKRPITRKTETHLKAVLGRHEADAPATAYKSIAVDEFALIADWYHDALLELVRLPDFKDEAAWIAKRLKISVVEAELARERLLRLGLLEQNAEGKLVDGTSGITTSLHPGQTSLAARTRQKQLLKKAYHAVDRTPLELRDNSAITLALAKQDLPLARQLISEFRRRFDELVQSAKDFDEVYQLVIALYPLTQIETNSSASPLKGKA